MTFRAPKYSCTICGKVFRRNKQHYNHVMNCKGSTVGSKGYGRTMTLQQIEQEYQAPKYIGRDYNFNAIHPGNRHLRTGIPMQTISKGRYRSAAI